MSNFRPYPKQESNKKLFNKPALKKKVTVTGELEVFRKIVLSRGSKSEISGEKIEDITVSSMAHILSKKQYPLFRLNADNICIMTPDEHREYDQGSEEYLRTLPEWKWLFERKAELIEKYKQAEKEIV